MNIDFGLEGNLIISVPPNALLTVNLTPSATSTVAEVPTGAAIIPADKVGVISIISMVEGALSVTEPPTALLGAVVSVIVPIASLEEILSDYVFIPQPYVLLSQDGFYLLSEDGFRLT